SRPTPDPGDPGFTSRPLGHEPRSVRPTRSGALPDDSTVRRAIGGAGTDTPGAVDEWGADASPEAARHHTRAYENAASASPNSRIVSASVPTCVATRIMPPRVVTVRP